MRVTLLIVVVLVALTAVAAMPYPGGAKAILTTAVRHQMIADKINSNPASTWTAGLNNKFVGKSREQIRHLMGALKTPPENRLPIKDIEPLADLPDTFDARTAWPNCPSIALIRDQSDCGSCWAFGAVEAATDRMCIETNGTVQDMISANDLVACCDSCGYGCSGGYLPATWDYLTSTGIVTGGNFNDSTSKKWCQRYSLPNCDHHEHGQYWMCSTQPEFPTPNCTLACDEDTDYKVKYASDRHVFASAYGVGSNWTDIATEILLNGPVEAAFTVYEDFLTYKSGVYSHQTGDVDGGHAIKILGWGTENNTPYWLVANSWNADWGDNGFFKIVRGTDECGIEDEVVAGKYKA